jgi:hypothetical protein
MSATSRSWRPALAGLVLALDGVGAWLLSLVALLLSTSVSAVQGRTGNSNDHLVGWALGLFALGLVAFFAAWRTRRGTGVGHTLGFAVAIAVAVAAGAASWAGLTARPMDAGTAAVAVAVLLMQVAVPSALNASRPSRP